MRICEIFPDFRPFGGGGMAEKAPLDPLVFEGPLWAMKGAPRVVVGRLNVHFQAAKDYRRVAQASGAI